MPYVIDAITAQTINVNSTLTVNGQPILGTSFYDNGNSSINSNINWSNGSIQEINLDDNPTLTFSNGVLGDNTSLLLKQQLPGQRTITWPTNVIWSGGIAPVLQNVPGAGSLNPYIGTKTITTNMGQDGVATYMISASNGKYIVAFNPQTSTYDGVTLPASSKIFRINSDATLDNTFVAPTYGTPYMGNITIIKKLASGKYLVGGDITNVNGGPSPSGLIRLNTDGSFDSTFNSGNAGFTSMGPTRIWDIHEYSDGSLLVGGEFSNYNGGIGNSNLIKIDTNGNIISSFTNNSGYPNSVVRNIKLQSDGKIVIVGDFSSFGMITAPNIIRLNPDGTPDSSFLSNVGFGFSYNTAGLAIQPDDKIIVGSLSANFNNIYGNKLYRLNSDGTADTAFITAASTSGINVYNAITGIQLYGNGKIIMSTNSGSLGGRYNLFTFDSSGTMDLNDLDLGAGWDGVGMQAGYGYINSMVYNEDQTALLLTGSGVISGKKAIAALYPSAILTTLYNVVNFDYNGTYYIGS